MFEDFAQKKQIARGFAQA